MKVTMINGPDPRILAAAESDDPCCGKEFNPALCFTRHRVAKVKESRGKEYGPCAYCPKFVTKSADNQPEIKTEEPTIMTTATTATNRETTQKTERLCPNPGCGKKLSKNGFCFSCAMKGKRHRANNPAASEATTKPAPKSDMPGVGEYCPQPFAKPEAAWGGNCAEAKPFLIHPPETPAGNHNILRRALRAYGDRAQMMKAAEESAELSAAILRYVSPYWNGKNHLTGLIEEVADVEIMCKQLRLIFGNDMVDKMIESKLNRLEKRLNDE